MKKNKPLTHKQVLEKINEKGLVGLVKEALFDKWRQELEENCGKCDKWRKVRP
jgi:hypothetical protein